MLVDTKPESLDELLTVPVVAAAVVAAPVVAAPVTVEVGRLLLMDGTFPVDVLMKLLLSCLNCSCCFGEKDRQRDKYLRSLNMFTDTHAKKVF